MRLGVANGSGHRETGGRRLADEVAAWAIGGEQQGIEFKAQMPGQARDLGKEIAAFATSNAGVILIGVSDSGEVIGVPELTTQKGRAELRARVEGIVASSVKPSTTPHLAFADMGDAVVAVIFVEQGPAPVYYAGGVPYVRQLTSARPATPEEVVERVIAWQEARVGHKPKTDELLSEVLQLVIETLADVADTCDDDRLTGQWLDQLRSTFAERSDAAWRLSSRCSASRPALEIELDQLASLLHDSASMELFMESGWAPLKAAISAIGAAALEIRRNWLDAELASSPPGEVESQVDDLIRMVVSLAKRAEAMTSKAGGVTDLQTKAGELGWALLRAAQLGIGWGGETGRAELAAAALQLRHAEVRELYMDGGASVRAVVADVTEASARLEALLS